MAKSNIPPGGMVELSVDTIDEGKFRKQINRAISRAYRELLEYEKQSEDPSGKAVVTCQVQVFRTKGARDHFSVVHQTKITVPSMKNVSVVKARGEKLLCQPVGSSQYDPDQQTIFDADGRIIGGTDPETGEVIDPNAPSPVAGKIVPQTAAQ